MKAEMASETRRSRAHTATTGSGCAPDSAASDSLTGAGFGGGVAMSGIVFIFYTQEDRSEVRGQISEVNPDLAFHLYNLASYI